MESLYTSAIDRKKKVISKPKVYTMEEAIEAAGFGIFQIKLIALTGFAYEFIQ